MQKPSRQERQRFFEFFGGGSSCLEDFNFLAKVSDDLSALLLQQKHGSRESRSQTPSCACARTTNAVTAFASELGC